MSESVVSRRDFLQKVGIAVAGGAAGVLLDRPETANAQAATPPKPTVAPPTLTPAEVTATRTAKQAEIDAESDRVRAEKLKAFQAAQAQITPTTAPRPTEKPTGAGTTNPNAENQGSKDPNAGLKTVAAIGGAGVAALTGAAEIIAHRKAISKLGSKLWPFGRSANEAGPTAAPATRGDTEDAHQTVQRAPDAPQVATRVEERQGALAVGTRMAEVDDTLAQAETVYAPTRNTGSAAAIPAGVESVSEAIQQQHDQVTQQMLHALNRQLLEGDITPEDYKRLLQALYGQRSAPAPGNAGAAVSPDVPATSAATPPPSPAHPVPALQPQPVTPPTRQRLDPFPASPESAASGPEVHIVPPSIKPLNGDLMVGINDMIEKFPDWVGKTPLPLEPEDVASLLLDGVRFDVNLGGIPGTVMIENSRIEIQPNGRLRIIGKLTGSKGSSDFDLSGVINPFTEEIGLIRGKGDLQSKWSHKLARESINNQLEDYINFGLTGRIDEGLPPGWIFNGFGIDTDNNRLLLKLRRVLPPLPLSPLDDRPF